MIVSTDWLAEYVSLAVPVDQLVERLALSGLNHESTTQVGDDTAVEIEVTSNRPDCLGHIGVARELSVLYQRPLLLPRPRPLEAGDQAVGSVAVEIADRSLCPFYSARVIRGVRVGKSPAWIVNRLATVGVASVNNIVDITNYVMLECGQPLHAFDLSRVLGGKISVRPALQNEVFEAINHRRYELDPRMCVIADAERPLALAGVMGGADSEISDSTVDVLIESGQFAPLAVRTAARSLVLSSASSFRFERGPDPAAVDWASRRAAMLILELAGGQLEHGVASAGELVQHSVTVPFAVDRVRHVLGVDIPWEQQQKTLSALGFVEQTEGADDEISLWHVPSWRRDVTREIDLVEEVGRIVGYDLIPEDATITARSVADTSRQKVTKLVADVLMAAGCCEAMTRSVVDETLDGFGSPWTSQTSLTITPPLVRGANRLRRSLLPSLLEARSHNFAAAAPHGDLFEIARCYLPEKELPAEPLLLSVVVTGEFSVAKGLVETVLRRLGIDASGLTGAPPRVSYRPMVCPCLSAGRSAEVMLSLAGHPAVRVGVVGEVAPALASHFKLGGPVSAVELRLDMLDSVEVSDRSVTRPSEFPPVERDLNLVVDEDVPWSTIASAIDEAAAGLLERLSLTQVWRDDSRIGPGRKSLVVSLSLRSSENTLSGDEVKAVIDEVVVSCNRRCGAALRA
jgi:phenylalanyl-tRNA synthetase beta chain